MFRETERVFEQALELPAADRHRLADRLYESLPEDEIAEAWLDEAVRRKAAWDSGQVTGIDGNEVIRGLRDRAQQ